MDFEREGGVLFDVLEDELIFEVIVVVVEIVEIVVLNEGEVEFVLILEEKIMILEF